MKRNLIAGVALLGLALAGCTKDPIDNLTSEESRIYVTNYDTTAVFSNFQTFRIADSVAYIENNRLVRKARTSGDAAFVDAVRTALIARGYTEAAGNTAPDLGVTTSVITNTATYLVDYANYGGAYGGYWDPFYWGYSNFNYAFPSYYGLYETGETALSIDIIDLKNAARNGNRLNGVWSGLIRGSGIFSATAVSNGVAALFNQSPYLTNK